ncbi:MAG: ABC transporter ATP-binding protein [Chitinispirillaceae bacterium]|nr:ABC transporter ATP-binding protein [Chitinispirillaceae bacterium]
MSPAPVVCFNSCTKEYNGRTVLDIPSLRFDTGKTYAVSGHNGAGKTTLLRLIAGLEQPSSGTVTLGVTPGRIGFCFQKPYMFRGTVGKNISWGLDKKRCGNVRELASMLHLDHLMEQPAKKMSAGEMQKVAMARVLARDPELLLLDEPFANLDAQARDSIEEQIRGFVENGNTCIMATHMTDHAARFSAAIIRLENGKVIQGDIVNIFEGIIEAKGDLKRIKVTENVHIICAAGTSPGKTRFLIAASDIVLSRAPFESSMRNSFSGTVTGLRQSGNAVLAIVDIGIPLKVLITRESSTQLGLSLWSKVTVSFKAVSVVLL